MVWVTLKQGASCGASIPLRLQGDKTRRSCQWRLHWSFDKTKSSESLQVSSLQQQKQDRRDGGIAESTAQTQSADGSNIGTLSRSGLSLMNFACDRTFDGQGPCWLCPQVSLEIASYRYTLRTKTRRNLRIWKIPELLRQNQKYFYPFWKYGLGMGSVRGRYGLATGSKSIPEVFNRKPRFSYFFRNTSGSCVDPRNSLGFGSPGSASKAHFRSGWSEVQLCSVPSAPARYMLSLQLQGP